MLTIFLHYMVLPLDATRWAFKGSCSETVQSVRCNSPSHVR